MVKAAALLRMRPRRMMPLKLNRPPTLLMAPNAWDASMDIKQPKQKKQLPQNLQKTSRDLHAHLVVIHVPNVLIAVLTMLKIKTILRLS